MNESTLALSLSILSFMMTVIWGGPLLRILRHFRIGKIIRVEEPSHHAVKMGTPTMGGVMFILPVLLLTVMVVDGASAQQTIKAKPTDVVPGRADRLFFRHVTARSIYYNVPRITNDSRTLMMRQDPRSISALLRTVAHSSSFFGAISSTPAADTIGPPVAARCAAISLIRMRRDSSNRNPLPYKSITTSRSAPCMRRTTARTSSRVRTTGSRTRAGARTTSVIQGSSSWRTCR